MAFGPLIDVPFIVGGFVVMAFYRKRLSSGILRTGVAAVLLSALTAVPLIIIEEDIDCMPAWCNHVIIPPTLPFILFEVIVLGALTLLLHVNSLLRVMVAFCAFGVGWELTVGGLVGAPLLVDLLLVPYVGVGYAYVSMLPIQVLLDARARGSKIF